MVGAVIYFTATADDPGSTADPGSAEQAPQADPGADALAQARRSLQQTSLPLSLLSGGVSQLVDGGRQLDDGANQLSVGLGQARDGAGQLSSGLTELSGGVGLLGDGAQQISGGVDEVVDRLSGLGEIQGQVTGSLRQVAAALSASPDPVAQGASARVTDLVAQLDAEGMGPDTLAQLTMLEDGARQLSYELNDRRLSSSAVWARSRTARGSSVTGWFSSTTAARPSPTEPASWWTAPDRSPVWSRGSRRTSRTRRRRLPSAQAPTSGADAEPQAAVEADEAGLPAWLYVVVVLCGLYGAAIAWLRPGSSISCEAVSHVGGETRMAAWS